MIKAEVSAGRDNEKEEEDRRRDAAKGYEVVTLAYRRARTGSRGKNDVIKKSNSLEHLLQPDEDRDGEEDGGGGGGGGGGGAVMGCQSATSSPVLPRHSRPRNGDDDGGGLPDDFDRREFHFATLPRRRNNKRPVAAPPPPPPPAPKPRHVYAMVSKNQGSTDKGSPPSPLPKPKRGGGGGGGGDSSGKGNNVSSLKNEVEEGASSSTAFNIPRLEVAEEQTEAVIYISSSQLASDGSSDRLSVGDEKKKPKEEDDSVSLQGIPSSEISHEAAESGQIYAVINKKTKKKKEEKKEETEAESPPVAKVADSTIEVKRSGVDAANFPVQKPPVKPPRMKPAKPAPYFARPGSPIPAILAGERSSSPVPPPPPSPDAHNPSPPPAIPDRVPSRRLPSPEEQLRPPLDSVVATAAASVSSKPPPPLPPSPLTDTPTITTGTL